jgi:hypothetical protein
MNSFACIKLIWCARVTLMMSMCMMYIYIECEIRSACLFAGTDLNFIVQFEDKNNQKPMSNPKPSAKVQPASSSSSTTEEETEDEAMLVDDKSDDDDVEEEEEDGEEEEEDEEEEADEAAEKQKEPELEKVEEPRQSPRKKVQIDKAQVKKAAQSRMEIQKTRANSKKSPVPSVSSGRPKRNR